MNQSIWGQPRLDTCPGCNRNSPISIQTAAKLQAVLLLAWACACYSFSQPENLGDPTNRNENKGVQKLDIRTLRDQQRPTRPSFPTPAAVALVLAVPSAVACRGNVSASLISTD